MATRKRRWKPKDGKSKGKNNGKETRIKRIPMNPGFAGEEWGGFYPKKNGKRRPRIAADFGNAPIATTGKLRAFSL